MSTGFMNMFGRTRRLVYDGKAKTVYEGPEPGTLIHHFKDETSSQKLDKTAVIAGKGVLNNRISAHLMTRLESIGIPTHFIKSVNMREQMVRQVEMIPIEMIIRNVAAGDFAKRLGIKEGTLLPRPIVEFFLKSDELNDPWVTEEHIVSFGWANPYELDEMMNMTWRINDYLSGLFTGVGLKLVDMKLEFGRLWGEFDELYLMLADEISPDSCRLWDAQTNEKLDKDRFREDLGNIAEAYQTVAEKLGLLPKGTTIVEDGAVNEQAAAALGEIANEHAQDRKLRAVPKTPSPGGGKPWK
jgi:phosphoribosylaminoimidazole-succinocarboxamide synthase